MKTSTHIIQFLVAAVIVVLLGGLAGWYYFVQRQIADTAASDAARGGEALSFGGGRGSTYENASGVPGESTPGASAAPGKPAPRLWHVTKTPVAGAGFAASSTSLYFAEVSSGNILEADTAISAVTRLTNTLMPKVYEAHFAPDGAVVMRFDADATVQTYSATLASTTQAIDSTSTPQTLKGQYLPQSIASLAVGPAHTLFYVLPESSGGFAVVRSDWKGASQKKLFSSALSGWDLYPLSDGGLVISQKPSDSVTGYAYTVSATGALSPFTGNLPALSVLPREGGARLFSTAESAPELFAKVSADASSVRLPIQTSADKCVWARGPDLIAYCGVPRTATGSGFLAERAKGAAHSSDSWYKVDVSSGTAEQLYAPDPSLDLDVESPSVDDTNSYIAFTNAADKSLWMLRIEP